MKASKFSVIAAGAAITLALAGTGAHAQPGPGGPGGPGGPMHMMMHGGAGVGPGSAAPAEYAAKRLEWLKTELQINAGQEAVWTKYAAAAKGAAESMAAHRKEMHGAAPLATVPERLDQRLAAMKAGLATMENVNAATKELYGALSPEQRKVADRWMAQTGRHPRGWGGPGPGRGPGPGVPPGPGAGPRG